MMAVFKSQLTKFLQTLTTPSPGPVRAGSSTPLARGLPSRADYTKPATCRIPSSQRPLLLLWRNGEPELQLQEMSILSRQEILGTSLRTGTGQQEYWLLSSDLRAVRPAKSRWCCWAIRAPCTALASRTPLTLCLTDFTQVPGTSSFHPMQSQQTSHRKKRRNQVLNHPRSGSMPAFQPPSCPRQPFLQIQH